LRPIRSRRFQTDLDNILEYIASKSPAAADKLLLEVEQQAAQLEHFARMGRVGRLTGTHELVIARTPYLIVYSTNGVVILLRLLHGAQKRPPSRFDPLN